MTDTETITWQAITCVEREALVDKHGRSYNGFNTESGITVLAGRTDLGGFPPIMVTVWGYGDGERPVLKDVRHPARKDFPEDAGKPDREPCEHYVPGDAS